MTSSIHHVPCAVVAVGGFCCQPAGATGSPWSARVTFRAMPGEVIAIAAATGGHVATVERFAVTGVRVG